MLTTLGSPRKRTISGNSAETTSLGGASTLDVAVSLTNLTSYIQELRSFLPKASQVQAGGSGGREGGKAGGTRRGRDEVEAPAMEDHVTGFIDRIIADSWDKMSVKVCEHERCKFCGSSTSMKETGQRQILHVAFPILSHVSLFYP